MPKIAKNDSVIVTEVTEKYDDFNLQQHVLENPGMWIGEPAPIKREIRVLDKTLSNFTENDGIVKKSFEYSYALVQIVSEIISNAFDQYYSGARSVHVHIAADGVITVINDGSGIDIANTKNGRLAPETIFLHERTSSNYKKIREEFTSGTHGYGSKLARIVSEFFDVYTVDQKSKRSYFQKFDSNGLVGDKTITAVPRGTPGQTKIVFKPNYKFFHTEKLDGNNLAVVEKRIYDLTFNYRDRIKCYYRGVGDSDYKLLTAPSIQVYTKNHGVSGIVVCRQKFWNVAIGIIPPGESKGFVISFVNGITPKQGTHIKHVLGEIRNAVKKKLNITDKTRSEKIRKSLVVFIEAMITLKRFSSQTKEELTTSVKDFDEQFKFNRVDDLMELGLGDYLEVKKRNISALAIKKFDKLTDSEFAGKHPEKAVIIITEGDSAATAAIMGRSAVDDGTKIYAVYAARGKIQNPLKMGEKSSFAESDIETMTGIFSRIIGLETNKLRYCRVVLMSDADPDGSHIKGLFMAVVRKLRPDLLKIPGFISCFQTPAVKVFADPKYTKLVAEFNTVQEYENWRRKNPNTIIHVKYYKGLSTNTREEMTGYFSELDNHLVEYIFTDTTLETLDMAFGPDANPRKEWILRTRADEEFDVPIYIENGIRRLKYDDFINNELIQFSIESITRALPKIDGLKPVQRKILYTILKHNITKPMKMVAFCGMVTRDTQYHKGDTSLSKAAIKMAQNFVGSNNINLLEPEGNFGSRLLGGKDAGAARYIATMMTTLTRLIFRVEDDPLLEYMIIDDEVAEPRVYHPIIPMLLINGTKGMGMGFSTNIPQYNPLQIIDTILDVISAVLLGKFESRRDSPYVALFPDDQILTLFMNRKLVPWYRWFTGTIVAEDDCYGIYGKIFNGETENSIIIKELPIQTWTNPYIADLVKREIPHVSRSSDINVEIEIDTKGTELDKSKIHSELGLRAAVRTTNMHLYDADGVLRYYVIPEQIFCDWWKSRRDMYVKRKAWWLAEYNKQCDKLFLRYDFISAIVDEKFVVARRKFNDIIAEMATAFPTESYPAIPDIADEYKKIVRGSGIDDMTEEGLERLADKINDLQKRIEDLEALDPLEIWRNELGELRRAYLQWEIEEVRKRTVVKKKPVAAKPKTRKK